MSELLLCARPHTESIDYATERFVVGRDSGVDYGDAEGVHHLERGDAVPSGALPAEALRCLYEPPVRAIETFAYARLVADLREACARRGTDLGADDIRVDAEGAPPACVAERPAPRERFDPKDLEHLSRKQLSDLCYRAGLATNGTAEQLRGRLASHLA